MRHQNQREQSGYKLLRDAITFFLSIEAGYNLYKIYLNEKPTSLSRFLAFGTCFSFYLRYKAKIKILPDLINQETMHSEPIVSYGSVSLSGFPVFYIFGTLTAFRLLLSFFLIVNEKESHSYFQLDLMFLSLDVFITEFMKLLLISKYRVSQRYDFLMDIATFNDSITARAHHQFRALVKFIACMMTIHAVIFSGKWVFDAKTLEYVNALEVITKRHSLFSGQIFSGILNYPYLLIIVYGPVRQLERKLFYGTTQLENSDNSQRIIDKIPLWEKLAAAFFTAKYFSSVGAHWSSIVVEIFSSFFELSLPETVELFKEENRIIHRENRNQLWQERQRTIAIGENPEAETHITPVNLRY